MNSKTLTQIQEARANRISHPDIVPGAYKPMVSLSTDELKTIQDNIKVWMEGDLESVDTYIQITALSIWQVMGAIALKDVKGRNGLNARIQAAKNWFEMAKRMQDLVKGAKDR